MVKAILASLSTTFSVVVFNAAGAVAKNGVNLKAIHQIKLNLFKFLKLMK